jgi:hypothetical protein
LQNALQRSMPRPAHFPPLTAGKQLYVGTMRIAPLGARKRPSSDYV